MRLTDYFKYFQFVNLYGEKDKEKISVIIPAYNEAKTVDRVIKEALALKEVGELILVDDGSSDGTEKKIQMFKKDKNFIYIKHLKNRGKGKALKTGVHKAKNEIILLLDADLRNITSAKIKRIIKPVIDDEVDVSRAAFYRSRGRVTEYAAKPMMRILFPDMHFEQPISGQICAKKSFLESIDLENRYGVDIGILFDAIQTGQRIVEVNIGKLEHKANSEETISEMAKEVLETMIKKAGLIQHKYNLVIFTFDNTLIKKENINSIYRKIGIEKKINILSLKLKENEISLQRYLLETAKLFKNVKSAYLKELCSKVSLSKYSPEVVTSLKKRKYQTAIISINFSPIVNVIAERLGIDNICCIGLEEKDGIFTGKVTSISKNFWFNDKNDEAIMKKAFFSSIRKAKAKPQEAIVVISNEIFIPLINYAGMSLAYCPQNKQLKELSDKTISIQAEILAIIE